MSKSSATPEKRKHSALKIIEVIVIIILIILIGLILGSHFIFKSNQPTPEIFGYKVYLNTSDNMDGNVPKNSLVLVSSASPSELVAGNVVLCKIGSQENYSLMGIQSVEVDEAGVTSFIVKSNTATNNQSIRLTENEILGKATKQDALIGKIIAYATTQNGVLILVVIPSTVILILLIISIIVGKKKSPVNSLDAILEKLDEDEAESIEEEQPFEEKRIKEVVPTAPSNLTIDDKGKAEYIQRRATASNDILDKIFGEKGANSKAITSEEFNPQASTSSMPTIEEELAKIEERKRNLTNPTPDPSARTINSQVIKSDKAESILPTTKVNKNKAIDDLMKMIDKELKK